MKIRCDSNCRPCVFEGGPSRDVTDQFQSHYCPTCRKAFFCDVGVVQQFSRTSKVAYSCVDCTTPLLMKSLDEISLLQAKISYKHESPIKKISIKNQLRRREDPQSLKTLSMLYNTKTISNYHHSLIEELCRISGISPQIISNFAREYGISDTILNNLSGDNREVLVTLTSLQPNFVEVIHSILIGRDPVITGGLALRFTVFSGNIGDIVFIQPSGALIDDGPFDLIAFDHQGMLIWIFCVQGNVDHDDISRIVNPILNQNLEELTGISRIYIVAQGFSWVAKQLLRKYQGIVVREGKKTRTIPFELWTEEKKTDGYQIHFKRQTL